MSRQMIYKSMLDAQKCLAEVLSDDARQLVLEDVVNRLVTTFQARGKVLIGGNGGSMADAMHFAEEWTGRFRKDRKPFPVMAMSDPTHLTCVANDFGFEHVFGRIVEAFAGPDDMVILLSTSGDSPNLIFAAEAARRSQTHVVGFIGRDGGKLSAVCDTVFIAPGDSSDRIQEIHMMCLHILIEAAEAKLGVS